MTKSTSQSSERSVWQQQPPVEGLQPYEVDTLKQLEH